MAWNLGARLPGWVGGAIAAGLLLSVAIRTAEARSADTTFRAALERVDAVAVVRTDEVRSIRGVRMGVGRVLRSYKGLKPDERVVFVAQATWVCDDTSRATAGGTALRLFIDYDAHPRDWIKYPRRLLEGVAAQFGEGTPTYLSAQIPIFRRGGRDCVSLRSYFHLPAVLRPATDDKICALDDVEAYLERVVAPATPEQLAGASVPNLVGSGSDEDWHDVLKTLPALAGREHELVSSAVKLVDSQLPAGLQGVSERAFQVVERLGPAAVPALIEVLGSAGHDYLGHRPVQMNAARCLARIPVTDPAAVEALMARIRDVEKIVEPWQAELAAAVVDALGASGVAAKPAVGHLVRCLDPPEQATHDGKIYRNWLIDSAIYALGRIGPDAQEAVPALLDLARHDVLMPTAHPYEPTRAAVAMAAMGPGAVPELVRGLDDANPSVRHVAAHALAQLGPEAKEAAGQLEKLLADEHEAVRAIAKEALVQVRDPNAPAILVKQPPLRWVAVGELVLLSVLLAPLTLLAVGLLIARSIKRTRPGQESVCDLT